MNTHVIHQAEVIQPEQYERHPALKVYPCCRFKHKEDGK